MLIQTDSFHVKLVSTCVFENFVSELSILKYEKLDESNF